jgi:hypothetical protein
MGRTGASLAGRGGDGERRQGFRAVGVAASQLARPIIARRGGGLLVRLKAEWPAVIGADWAAQIWPSALGRDGTLRLRVAAAAAALELQHRSPLVIERINLFFGRVVATRITLVQGPLPVAAAAPEPLRRPLAPEEAQSIAARVDGVADPELRAALLRLGHAVAAAAPPVEVARRRKSD